MEEFPQIQAKITLTDAEPQDRVLYSDLTPAEIRSHMMTALASTSLITFDRIIGNKRVEFTTQVGNIINIEATS